MQPPTGSYSTICSETSILSGEAQLLSWTTSPWPPCEKVSLDINNCSQPFRLWFPLDLWRSCSSAPPWTRSCHNHLFSGTVMTLCVCASCVCVCGIGIGPASANCCRCIGQQGEISFGSLRQDLLPPSAFRSGVSIFNCRLLGLYDPRHIFFGKFFHYHNPYSHRGRHVACEGGLPQTNFLLENLVCCFDLSEVNQK